MTDEEKEMIVRYRQEHGDEATERLLSALATPAVRHAADLREAARRGRPVLDVRASFSDLMRRYPKTMARLAEADVQER